MSAALVSGTRLRCGTRTYLRSLMTEGTASLSEAECSTSPDDSLCRISAFSARTRPTARCRQTVVRGSYVMLSSSTLRKATSQAGPPAGCRVTRDQCDRTTAEAPTPNCRQVAFEIANGQ